MSDISSAGIGAGSGAYGKTCRKYVLRRVDVPVVPGTAGRARPVPGVQAEFGEQMPAHRAGLAGGVPAVDHDQVPPRPGRLVRQQLTEGAPPAVADGPGQGPVPDHVLHRQVFDHDHVMVADQGGGGAVQEIGAGRADLPVRAGDLRPGLDPVRGTALAAGQPALIPGQGLCPAGQLPRVGDLCSLGGDREVLDTQVHAHDRAGGGKLFRAGAPRRRRRRTSARTGPGRRSPWPGRSPPGQCRARTR